MCGIFGFITTAGTGPDLPLLRRLALVTQTRGAQAFGLAWLEADGIVRTFKRPGPAKAYLAELERCARAVILIGHCRLATHGLPADNRNNHPHAAGRGQLVHNGVIHNYQDLLGRWALSPQSQCDSEVLGLLMARCPGALLQRAAWAAGQCQGDLALLGLWSKPHRLLVARRGRPLSTGSTREGHYFASLPEGLPGWVQSIPDGSARLLTLGRGSRLRDAQVRQLPAEQRWCAAEPAPTGLFDDETRWS